ncbi:MAG: hypothetical protein O7F16_00875 [Acidobacteria bacterium]|nr:hypothetical protein [Acidobacteriota bacterium]
MICSTVTYLFMLELGVGSLLCLWVLRRFDLTRSLRRLLAGLGGAMVVVGLPFGVRALSVSGTGFGLLEAHVFWPLAVVSGTIIYVVSLPDGASRRCAWVLAGTVVAGMASVTAGALAVGAGSGLWDDIQRSGYFLSAMLLLGSTFGAMILGHWYLVDRKMAIDPLRVAACFLMVAILARIAVVSVPTVHFLRETLLAQPETGLSLDLALFWAQRALFGLAGPLVLGFMVWRTVRLRATQAATGLLYIVLIFVIIGEILSHYLYLKTERFL